MEEFTESRGTLKRTIITTTTIFISSHLTSYRGSLLTSQPVMSGTFVTLAGAKFEISSHKAHKSIKKVGRKYEVALVNSSFMSVLFSLPVTIHMAFVEEMLIKQM